MSCLTSAKKPGFCGVYDYVENVTNTAAKAGADDNTDADCEHSGKNKGKTHLPRNLILKSQFASNHSKRVFLLLTSLSINISRGS